jgi:hypothetical protein
MQESFSTTKHKARTVMITTVSPAASSADHTINSLRYADRVKVAPAPLSLVSPSPGSPRPHSKPSFGSLHAGKIGGFGSGSGAGRQSDPCRPLPPRPHR